MTQLWERELPIARDRSTLLTPDEVAKAAFEIAESESLYATSVKRVANKLAVPAARLENYLPSKEDLLDLMLDVALGEVILPAENSDAGWRTDLADIAQATYGTVSRHPWLVDLIGGRPPSGPNGLRFIERTLDVLASTGMPMVSAAQCVNAVQAMVCGSVQMHAARLPGRRENRPSAANAEYLQDAVAGTDYPNLAKLFAAAAELTSDNSFAEGLDCLLDGIALRVAGLPSDPAIGTEV